MYKGLKGSIVILDDEAEKKFLSETLYVRTTLYTIFVDKNDTMIMDGCDKKRRNVKSFLK